MPRKKKATEQTTDEALRRLFPKSVIRELKKLAANPKPKPKPPKRRAK